MMANAVSEHHEAPAARGRVTPPEGAPDWHFLSHVVIRRTGFPFEWLDAIATPESAALAAALAADGEELDGLVQALLKELIPAAVAVARQAGHRERLRALSKLRHKVGHRTLRQNDVAQVRDLLPVEVRAALECLCLRQQRLEERTAHVARMLAGEMTQSHARLRDITRDPYFQEAIFLSNPDLYNNSLQPFLAQSARPLDTAFERTLLSYVQRFCAKNDTASFFGPLNCGRIVPGQDAPLVVETRGTKYARREVFISFWVVDQLAEAISAEPSFRPFWSPRLHPLCRWQGSSVYFPSHDRHARLSAVQEAILAQVDGNRTIAGIAAATGYPPAQVGDEVDSLVAAKVLICRLEPPSTIFHPFSYLVQQVRQLPDGERRVYWLGHLERFEELRQQFVDADLPTRQQVLAQMDAHFTMLTGKPPRRAAGGTYADRSLIYEDCEGTYQTFQFGEDFFQEFKRRLKPILDLCAAHGTLLWRHYQALGRAVFQEISADGTPVSYAHFISAMQQRQRAGLLPRSSTELDEFGATLRRLVAMRSDGHVARISLDDLATLLKDVPVAGNCHISPDVMLAARDLDGLSRGDYQVVLGEVHQVIYVWGSQLYFYPQREAAEAQIAAHLTRMPEYDGLATVLNERQHKGLLNDAFPGAIVEVAALPSERAQARVPLAALSVALDGDRLVLCDDRTGQAMRLYTAGDEQLHLWALALPRVMPVPVQLGDHTPRIEIGGAVYQRERWRLPATEWGADVAELAPHELLVRAQGIMRRHRLPRRVFMHVASEPKPYYVDFANALCLKLLQHALSLNAVVTFTEMLPGPDQLWVSERDGHYCCEFRMTACRY